MGMVRWWNGTGRGKLKYRDKNLCQCHLSTDLTWTGWGSNSGFHRDRPRTDCLNHSTAHGDVLAVIDCTDMDFPNEEKVMGRTHSRKGRDVKGVKVDITGAATTCTDTRSALFRDITLRLVVILYRRFGLTYPSNLQWSRNARRLLTLVDEPNMLPRSLLPRSGSLKSRTAQP